MDYKSIYEKKKITADEAVAKVKSGDVIATSMCTMEPFTLLTALSKRKNELRNVKVYTVVTLGKYDFMYDPSYRGIIECESCFFTEHLRNGQKEGLVSLFPAHLHHNAYRWAAHNPITVFFGSVSAMDEHGYCRTSLSNAAEKYLAEQADLVIMEINPNMPMVGGDTEIHITDIDYVVEVNTPVPILPKGKLTEIEKTIGEHVATLVQDGDTIQLGIGGIPDAVAAAFMNKKDLGVHTEMITNAIADLVEAGVITGKKKSLHKGKIVGAFAWGDEKLYRMMHNNPSVMIMPGSYVNDPFVVAQNDNMMSINTALCVDLTGQVCSESIGTVQYSGSGGQNDTAEGAIHAKNGRSIIALKSTAKNGEVSTISAVLPLGSVVTLSRNNVDYIVTEYGIAQMKGRSVKERVENLIAIAHPKFRDQLWKDARKYRLIL